MANVFDEVHADAQGGGNVFEQIHDESTAPDDGILATAGRFATGVGHAIGGLYDVGKRLITPPETTGDTVAALIAGPAGPLLTDIGKSHLETAKKAYNAFKQGDMLSATGYGMATVLPAAGPWAAGLGEKIGDGQVAEGLGELAGGLALPHVIGAVPKLAGAVGDVARARGVPEALRASATRNFEDALNPTTNKNKAMTENKLAPGLAERGTIATSIDDLREDAQARMQHHGERIDAAFDRAENENLSINPAPMIEELQQHKQDAMVGAQVPDASKAYVQKLSDFQAELKAIAKDNGGMIPAGDLRKLRQLNDSLVAQSKGGFGLPPDELSKIDATKKYADAQRGAIAEAMPETAADNKEFSFWSNVDRVAGDTKTRRVGQKTSLTAHAGKYVGAAIGSAFGPKGAAIGAVVGGQLATITHSMIWDSVSAAAKSKVASLLEKGDSAGALKVANRAALDAAGGGKLVADGEVSNPAQAAGGENAGGAVQPESEGGAVEQAPGGQSVPVPEADAATQSGNGNETTVKVAGQTAGYKARYRLRELDDVQSSHNGLNFQPNPEFGAKTGVTNDRGYDNPVNQEKIVRWSTPAEFDPSYHVTDNPDATNGPIVTDSNSDVLGGNGRKNILDRVYAYNPRGASAYRSLLEQKAAQFGIDPTQVSGMKKPVLTRQIDDSAFGSASGRQNSVTDFNKKGTAEMTPAERAISDSRRVSTSTLDDIGGRLDAAGEDATFADVLKGKGGGEILQKLIDDGVVSPQERAAFADEGGLTKAGKQRIQSLMLGRFFRDPEQLDNIPLSLRNKLERVAAPLAQVEGLKGWNLSPDIQTAIDLVEEARQAHGVKNIGEFIKQKGLFGESAYSPQAVQLAKELYGSTAKQLTAAVRQYAGDAVHASKGASLFGVPPSAAEAFAAAFKAQ